MNARQVLPLVLTLPFFAHAETVADYSGASYGSRSVTFSFDSGKPTSTSPKGAGNYNVIDINGDLDFMQANGVTRIKTYDSGLISQENWSEIDNYINSFSAVNSSPSTASTQIMDMNGPFIQGGVSGDKWIIGQAAAKQMKVYAGTNVSSTMLSLTPIGTQTSKTVTLRTGTGASDTKTVNINPLNYTYDRFAGSPTPTKTINYSMAHWDIELAIMNAANARVNIQHAGGANYTATPQSGFNHQYTEALIIGNEVNANGLSDAQEIADVMAFAVARRAAYGLTEAELPITTSTNAAGVYQSTDWQNLVLANVDDIAFYNDYGFGFTSGQAAPGTTVEDGITNVVGNYNSFVSWLSSNGFADITPMLGEHGWPSASLIEDPSSTDYNSTNEGLYFFGKTGEYDGSLQQLAEAGATSFFFEFFDEPWKGNNVGTSSEGYFGVATTTQSSSRADPNNDPDNPAGDRLIKDFTDPSIAGDLLTTMNIQVPEPGHVAALVGLAGILAVAWSRRKRRI